MHDPKNTGPQIFIWTGQLERRSHGNEGVFGSKRISNFKNGKFHMVHKKEEQIINLVNCLNSRLVLGWKDSCS